MAGQQWDLSEYQDLGPQINASHFVASGDYNQAPQQNLTAGTNTALTWNPPGYGSSTSSGLVNSQQVTYSSGHQQYLLPGGRTRQASNRSPKMPVQEVQASNGNWKSALSRFPPDTVIRKYVHAAYEKWYYSQYSTLCEAISNSTPGSQQYNTLMAYLPAWQGHVNNAVEDAALNKCKALSLTLAQYEDDNDEQQRIVCAFYDWFARYNTDEQDGSWINALRQILRQTSTNPHGYLQAILAFHQAYISGDVDSDEEDSENESSEIANYSGRAARQQVAQEAEPSSARKNTGGKSSRSYHCPVEGCNAAPKRKADLKRHRLSVHARSIATLISCAEPNCHKVGEKGFTRYDHYVEHLRRQHDKEAQYPKRAKMKDNK